MKLEIRCGWREFQVIRLSLSHNQNKDCHWHSPSSRCLCRDALERPALKFQANVLLSQWKKLSCLYWKWSDRGSFISRQTNRLRRWRAVASTRSWAAAVRQNHHWGRHIATSYRDASKSTKKQVSNRKSIALFVPAGRSHRRKYLRVSIHSWRRHQ